MKKFLASLVLGLTICAGVVLPALITPDVYDKLFVKCNGTTTTFVDSSLTPKTITANGNATQLSLPTGVTSRTAGFFNGTTDYVVVPDSADWDTSGVFEIQFYMNPTTTSTFSCLSRNDDTDWNFSYNGSGTATVYFAGDFIQFSWTPTINTWYKWKLTRDGANLVTVFIDDVSKGTKTISTAISSSGVINIGRKTNGAVYFAGWMKNLTITKASTLVLDMRFDSPATSPLAPAIAFDGSTAGLSVASDPSFAFSGAFTVKCLVKFLATGQQIFLDGQFGSLHGITFNYLSGNMYVYVNGTNNITRPFTPVVGVWYEMCLTRDVSNNLYFFINGQQQGISVSYSATITADSYNFGKYSGASLNGFMREIFFSKSCLYSSNYTPPQNGMTVDTNTVLYIKGNENNGVTTFIDSETTPKTVTAYSPVAIKYTEDYRSCIFKDETGKFPYPVGSAKVDFFTVSGSGVGYFDGAGDYLSVPDSDDWNYGTSDVTQEGYFRFSAVAGVYSLIESGNISSDGIGLLQSSGTLYSYVNNSAVNAFTFTPVINTWYHISQAGSGTTLRLFINGTQVDSDTNSSNITSGTDGVKVGTRTASADYFSGLLDNIRISKGVARYTASFNPPDDYSGSSSASRRKKTNWFFFF